ncbi:branched-chain amino acid ABC transporter permease [Neobacillus novalis]|uniref:Branched-chain amino acid ABC transporter permease n=1 Tax=Neobacillus novalis TaxID=220687 RepID=A0AA95MHU7_9BACI|nr:branched-chain amino acid ABC transporter permease [Neobacillus novalis]WHY84004.1 branched-chain amino acid ABC transporter permease [Neobacillus novalis]
MSTYVTQLILSGIITGAVYGLIALGFTMVYNSTSVLNFAQGEFVMIGAVFSSVFITKYHMPYYVGVLLAISIAVAVGFGVERLSIRYLQRKNVNHIIMIMATLALAIIISNVTQLLVGTSSMYTPNVIDAKLSIGGNFITAQELIILGFLGLTVTGLWLFLNKTMYGVAMKATGIDKNAARMMGINIHSVILLSFVLSAGLSAIGGILIAPIISGTAQMGLPLAVKGFIAAVIGGVTNPFAGIVGGILIGLFEVFIAGYVSSSLVEIIVFLLLPIILIARPNGLLGSSR